MGKLFSLCLLCALAMFSSWLVEYFNLPIPAPIIGLSLLYVALLILGRVPVSLAWVSNILLRNLALFFVPATVAVVLFKDQLVQHGWLILSTLFVSTLVSLFVTAWVSQKFVVERHRAK